MNERGSGEMREVVGVSRSEMNMLMDKVGLDVFQFILSFLPPVPYLFQLQRVSKHYSQLCQLCMLEDCTELCFDEEAIYEMNDQMKELSNSRNRTSNNKRSNTCLEIMLQKLNPSQQTWMLFFRDILHRFKKLDRLVLKNMIFSNLVLFIVLVDWNGSLKELKLVECEFTVDIPCLYSIGNFSGTERTMVGQIFDTKGVRFLDCELQNDFTKNVPSRYMELIMEFDSNKIEKIKIISKTLNLSNQGYIPFLKCFPKLKSVFCPIFRSKTPTWESAMLLFPDVDFEPLPRELASNEISPEHFYINYLCKEFKLRKNRLEIIQNETIGMKSKEYIHNFFSDIITFLEVHAPFGLDTKVKDVRGNNIIQLAILFTNFDIVKFFIKYLTVLEDKVHATKELTQLFSSNNPLDGKNALFQCLSTHNVTNYFSLLFEFKVSFNLPANDGSTILHNLCRFGQLSKLQSLWQVLDTVSLEEKKYYLDFNLKNKNGETPLYLCKKNNMKYMQQQLESLAGHYGIDLKKEQDLPTVTPVLVIQQQSSPVTPAPNNSQYLKCEIL